MYDIVADVGSYQLFVPWCTCSRIISHRNEFSQAEREVGFPPVVERYVSEIISEPHHQIRVRGTVALERCCGGGGDFLGDVLVRLCGSHFVMD